MCLLLYFLIDNFYQNVTASFFKDYLISPLFLVYNVWQIWEIVYAKDGSVKEGSNENFVGVDGANSRSGYQGRGGFKGQGFQGRGEYEGFGLTI